MSRTQGPNERALVVMMHERGVKVTRPGDLAALLVLARTMARQLDEPDATAAAASVYLSTLKQLLELTKPNEAADDESPAETVRQLRSV